MDTARPAPKMLVKMFRESMAGHVTGYQAGLELWVRFYDAQCRFQSVASVGFTVLLHKLSQLVSVVGLMKHTPSDGVAKRWPSEAANERIVYWCRRPLIETYAVHTRLCGGVCASVALCKQVLDSLTLTD